MKKTIFGILGTAACMAALLVNVSLANDKSSKDTNLVELSIVTDANAECMTSGFLNGQCSATGARCVFSTSPFDCNPYGY